MIGLGDVKSKMSHSLSSTSTIETPRESTHSHQFPGRGMQIHMRERVGGRAGSNKPKWKKKKIKEVQTAFALHRA